MNYEKGSVLAWVLMVIFVLLVGGGLFYYYQYVKIPELEQKITDLQTDVTKLQGELRSQESATDETSDWKTYTSTKYGYSFKYPKDWNYYDKGVYNSSTKTYRDAGRIVIVDDKTIGNIPDESDYTPISFMVNVQDTQLNFTEIKSDTYSNHTEVKIDGQNAIKSVSNKPSELGGVFATTYYINYKSKTYIIHWPNENAKGDHDDIYDDILSTFKFTK